MRPTATVLLILGALLSAACGGEPPPPEPKAPRPVRHVTVRSSDGVLERTLAGVAQAGTESRLSFQVPGTVRRIDVEVGDRLAKGDRIAALDPTDYELGVQDLEAALDRARAESTSAASNYERIQALYANDNASRSDLSAARARAESAEATVRSTEKKLEQARRQVGYTRLNAPVAGRVASVDVALNENVRAGQQILLLTSGRVPEVEVAMPAGLIGRVVEGSTVDVRFDALAGRSFPASVSEVGVATLGRSSTYPVTVRLERDEPDVRPGMSAEVTFAFPGAGTREVFVLPPEAVSEDAGGRFVFVVEPGAEGTGTARRRSVGVGGLSDEGLEVLSGLSEGELVVTAGVSRIADGQVVALDPRHEGS
jgi:RND family efflux transporter MFP subunit